MKRINKVIKKNTNQQSKTELLRLQKDWESAKKKITMELKKEKNPRKKNELKLIADYFTNNYVDIENQTISSKQKKTDLANFCGSKEFK